ncbi:MAG: hypothetical protein KY459_12165 [Acidobacteria bacterium]|nr:hypothetical protein [Acidobacteriota bacterium]
MNEQPGRIIDTPETPTHCEKPDTRRQATSNCEEGLGRGRAVSDPGPAIPDQSEPDIYPLYIAERNRLIDSKRQTSGSFDRAVLTLSSGAIALSVTFLQFTTPAADSLAYLNSAWLLFAIAILFILFSLLSSQKATEVEISYLDVWYHDWIHPNDQDRNMYTQYTRWLNFGAAIAFFIAVFLFGLFASINSTKGKHDVRQEQGDGRQSETNFGSGP